MQTCVSTVSYFDQCFELKELRCFLQGWPLNCDRETSFKPDSQNLWVPQFFQSPVMCGSVLLILHFDGHYRPRERSPLSLFSLTGRQQVRGQRRIERVCQEDKLELHLWRKHEIASEFRLEQQLTVIWVIQKENEKIEQLTNCSICSKYFNCTYDICQRPKSFMCLFY